MTQFYFYFYVGLAAGGILTSAFLVRQIYKIISDQSIPRKAGKKPITPQGEATIYWTFVGWTTLCTMGIIYGTALAISKLMHS